MRIIWNGFRKSGFILIGVAGLMLVVSAFAQLGMNIEYHIGFVNKTGHDLDGVCVYYGTIEAAAKGGLVKGGRSTEGPVTLPLPSDAEVRWIGNGVRHAVKAKLQGAVPKRLTYHWTLYFVINEDGTVQAKAIKLGDKAAMAELTKGLRPKGEYLLGFVNKTGRDLRDVSAYYGERRIALAADLPTRAKVAYSGPLPPPIPPEAEVRWNENGTVHSVKAKLQGVVQQGFEGRIFFVIKIDGTVEVHPIKTGDDAGAFKIVR